MMRGASFFVISLLESTDLKGKKRKERSAWSRKKSLPWDNILIFIGKGNSSLEPSLHSHFFWRWKRVFCFLWGLVSRSRGCFDLSTVISLVVLGAKVSLGGMNGRIRRTCYFWTCFQRASGQRIEKRKRCQCLWAQDQHQESSFFLSLDIQN